MHSSLQAEIVAIELNFCLTAIPLYLQQVCEECDHSKQTPRNWSSSWRKSIWVIFLTFPICRGSCVAPSLFSEVRFRRLFSFLWTKKVFLVSTRLPTKTSSSSSWINVRCSVSKETTLFAVIFVFHGDALYFVINLLSSLIIASSISAEKLYSASGVGRS